MIKKILVANRGEIAVRIMRSARELHIPTVAVFSEADRRMPFVSYADEAVAIGPAAPSKSYLDMEGIIGAALDLKADAIHPGYGFLSENAAFARKVREAGIIFIGPSPESIEMMGNKIAAKKMAARSGVPLVPGTSSPIPSLQDARSVISSIGFPVLIKAAAGGGGKGMRVVERMEELEDHLRSAASEAKTAFGDDAVFLEKYISAPRHVEIQVLADQHGHCVHLFERECSIQRRHQKLIEEAPSSFLTSELRARMGNCAIEVARSCGYYGAGTVEFLVAGDLQFYFLEMNTRLQVEHPVTELITGIDLVKEQIRIASGEPLSFAQEDLRITGHAIELRVCAEDPARDFLPETGTLEHYHRPGGIGIRVDDGYEQGLQIPIQYDSLLSKLIAWGSDRQEAIERLARAIDEYEVVGIPTTLQFGKWAIRHPKFAVGDFDTFFIPKYFRPEYLQDSDPEDEEIAAVIAAMLMEKEKNKIQGPLPAYGLRSKWKNRERME
jgi:acetyl-CoA carboxylase biotin carboxylase subunit